MNRMSAAETPEGVLVQWQTGYETNNLGFHVYREDETGRVRLTPSLVAGSALFAGTRTTLTAGRSYQWWDRSADRKAGAVYWLEDIDLDAGSRMHGPIAPVRSALPAAAARSSALLSETARSTASSESRKPDARSGSVVRGVAASSSPASASDLSRQYWIAGRPAVKIQVRQVGWYRVTRAQLLAAGLDPEADPEKLQLYTDGMQQPVELSDVKGNRLWRDAEDSLGFYGIGMDTPATDARAYWLVEGDSPGRRLRAAAPGSALKSRAS